MREGRSLVAIRDHDVAAGALGVAVGRQRIKSFAITSFITSAVGALYVYYLGTTTYEAYSLEFVINYFAIIIIGGMGSLLGLRARRDRVDPAAAGACRRSRSRSTRAPR